MPSAAEEALFGRSVVILRPQDRLDTEALLRALEPRPPRLLLLSIGYPPTPAQRRAVEAGLRLAADLGLRFEARLAYRVDDALDLLGLDDEVLQCASR
jgi:hypothetical protein